MRHHLPRLAAVAVVVLAAATAIAIPPVLRNATATHSPSIADDPISFTAGDIETEGISPQYSTIYAGFWYEKLDQRLHATFTSITNAQRSAFVHGLHHPEVVVISQGARFTYAYLRSLQARIDHDASALAVAGIHLSGTGQLPNQNKVLVGIRESDSVLINRLKALYGADAVQIASGQAIQKANSDRYGPPPYQGGMELEDGTYRCTAGYVGERWINGSKYYQLVTAGHCFGEPQTVFHAVAGQAPLRVGQINSRFFNGSTADAESMNITGLNGGAALATNQIITANGYSHTVDFLNTTQLQGRSVCKSGITTDQSCNFSVTATHQTVYFVTGEVTYDQVTACCDRVDFGDSGGPVYNYYQPQAIAAEGITSALYANNGVPTGQMSYSFIQNVRSNLNLYITTVPPSPL